MVDYAKTHAFWEARGKNAGLDELNVTMLRERLPELAAFIDRAEKAHLRRVLRLNRDMDVLDLGCGAGRMAIEFARACRSVVAVDFSQALVDRGRELAQRHGLANVRWVTASVVEFASDEQFDIIFAGGLLPYLSDADVARVLGATHGMLKPGGRFVSRNMVLSEKEAQPPTTPPDYEVTYRRTADYVAFFQAAGFEIAYMNEAFAFPAPAYLYDRFLPDRIKYAASMRAVLAAALSLYGLVDPLILRFPRLNSLLAGRRAKIVQSIAVCRGGRRPPTML